MAEKKPWRSHYTRDWAHDPFVRALDLEARMVYLELLDIAWDENGLKQEWIDTGEYVANRIGISKRLFRSCWRRVRDKFVEISPLVWSQTRLERERNRARKFSEKQSNNARGNETAIGLAEPAGASQSQSESHTQKDRRGLSAPPQPLLLEAQDARRDDTEPIVLELFEVLNAARMEVVDGARHLKPVEVNLDGIRSRLADGATPDEIRHVIAVTAAEVRVKPEAANWFNAESPFRPANFQRMLARTVKVASLPRQERTGFQQPDRPNNHPPSSEQRKRDYEESSARDRAERRKNLEAEGYRWTDDGRWYDPDGNELDDKARIIARAEAVS